MNGRTANSLPAELGPLLGREHDLHELTRLLREGTRLLTLRGPGGIGKTGLALHLAHAVREDYDHVLLVDLSALRAPEGLLLTVAASLPGVDPSSGDPAALVTDFAARHRLLLVLDNFEHLLPAATTWVGPVLWTKLTGDSTQGECTTVVGAAGDAHRPANSSGVR